MRPYWLAAAVVIAGCSAQQSTVPRHVAAGNHPRGRATALVYDFTLRGDAIYSSPPIQARRTLRVRFQVEGSQGTADHQASELAVLIEINGREIAPTFAGRQRVFGALGESSEVVDFSPELSMVRGPVVIHVKQPLSDYHCTYLQETQGRRFTGVSWETVNPFVGQYPSCRRDVPAEQEWGGRLIVETENTQPI